MKGWDKMWSLRVWFDMHIAHIYLQSVGIMYTTGGGRGNQGGKIGTILPAIPRNPSPHA